MMPPGPCVKEKKIQVFHLLNLDKLLGEGNSELKIQKHFLFYTLSFTPRKIKLF